MAWARAPIAPLALAFAAGIALAPRLPPRPAALVVLVGLAGAALAAARRRPRLATVPLLAAVAATGALRAVEPALPPDHVARLALPRAARVEGRLAAEPTAWAPERTRLLLDVDRVDGAPASGRVQIAAYGVLQLPLVEGQRVAADARLHPATGFRNPGTFDYAVHLAREGIRVVGSTRADAVVALEPPRPPWPARVRGRAVQAMTRALPPTSAALLAGLLLGERTGLPLEVQDGFRRAGVYHVLAVSGFNVALVASAVWTALALGGASRRLAAGAAIAAVLGFASVVGPEPSVVRATIMAVLVLAALLLERDASVANGLAAAALVILAVRPADLYDPGFQLSFAATAGIVAAPIPRGWLAGALAVSAAAQAAVLPITLVHFNQLSTVGLLANLGVVPLAGIATVLGLLAVALAAASEAIAAAFFDALWPVLLLLRAIVALAAAVPGAVVHLPAPGPAAVGAYAAALVLALLAWRRRAEPGRAGLTAGAAVALLGLAAALAAAPLLRRPDGRLRVTFLDVGQGDAVVAQMPDGRAILVDAGPGGPSRLDTGERVVAPFLWNRGVLRVAGAVVSHDDVDHAGGMAVVRRLFATRDTWDEAALGAAARTLGGATVTALPAGPPTGRGRNDAALVVRVDYGLASFLLASDLEAAGEDALAARGAPLGATVLKVAHHGARSATTPAFLAAVRPAFAVVSVGARNAYGHPDAGTLARLADAGARVYRTDRDGAVLFETDGRRLDVTTWADRHTDHYCLDAYAPC